MYIVFNCGTQSRRFDVTTRFIKNCRLHDIVGYGICMTS